MKVDAVFRWIYLIIGWLSLAAGVIGLFLPIWPTAPFVILAAWCFSKGSEKLHRWIISQKTIGPMILEWEQYGIIRLRAKKLATIALAISFTFMAIFVKVAWPIKGTVIAIGTIVMAYIWTRPSAPPSPKKPTQEEDFSP